MSLSSCVVQIHSLDQIGPCMDFTFWARGVSLKCPLKLSVGGTQTFSL